MKVFDPAGPLPTGTVVLEASAGTGKTHAIAALAVRYLAEDVVDIDHLAVISFSRMASAELRSRLRLRLGHTIAALTGEPSSVAPDETDLLLSQGDPEVVGARVERLKAAAADLDNAIIMTIHQFCQAMIDELGVLAEADPGARLSEDLSQLLDQVVADLYLARYAHNPAGAPFSLATAASIAREATARPDSVLVPAIGSELVAERRNFAAAVREEFGQRKAAEGRYSFDDQLLRLRAALLGPAADACAQRLRARCRVVLVDEFQDTDPIQWQILSEAFDGSVPLVLTGDPKQSIYAFRGADVQTYLEATLGSDDAVSLPVNHRSDPGVVTAVNALFHNVLLGRGITVPAVTAHRAGSRVSAPTGSPWLAPARLRCVWADTPLFAAQARERITADLTNQVIELLDSGIQLDDDGPRPIRAGDVAILVARNRRGRELADALTDAGIAVAFAGSDSIFASPAATDWLTLLRALEGPDRSQVRAAILTDFIGADLDRLARSSDAQLARWTATLHAWAQLLAGQGVAALFSAVQAATDQDGRSFAARVLSRPRGERDLTDYRHLAELLHANYSSGLRGQALVAWLAEQTTGPASTRDRLRRLETDRNAVQILTVHKAKGLEFPVVLIPEATDLWLPTDDRGDCLDYHDDGTRVLDVGGATAPSRAERLRQYRAEQADEQLRSLYVALTRAQSQVTMWWARTRQNTEASPLHRLLYRRRDQAATPEAGYPVDEPPCDHRPAQLDWLASAGIVVEECTGSTASRPGSATSRPEHLVPLGWHRDIDQKWRRTSYSGLTEPVHARPPLALTAEAVLDDEPQPAEETTPELPGTPSPMADLPGGTGFGSLVHHVLENLDWYTPDPDRLDQLRERLLVATTQAAPKFAIAGVSPQALADAMLPSLLTPLGSLTDGLALSAVPIVDRLSELTFEFGLGTRASTTTLGDVAALLADHLPVTDPLADYPSALADPQLSGQVLRGYLTGSIDSVLRIGSGAGQRFVVVDYKTNRLGPQNLTLQHYSTPAMTAEMIRTHYPLQALLYCVALHRFLRQRLDGYCPERHLGGVGYLFVRGMGGPNAGAFGVFDWYPPAGLVVALSELLADRGRP